MSNRIACLSVFIIGISLLCASTAIAQSDRSVQTGTPYQSLRTHFYYLEQGHYDVAKAASSFPDTYAPKPNEKNAVQLKQIYDGYGLRLQRANAPQDSFFRDSVSGNFIFTPFPNELPEIYLVRQNGEWKYAHESVQSIQSRYEELYPFGANVLMDLSPGLGHRKVLGIAIWQYLGILLLVGIGILVWWIFSHVLRPLVKRLIHRSFLPDYIAIKEVNRIARHLSALFILQLTRVALPWVQLPVKVNAYGVLFLKIASVIAISLLLLRLANILVAIVNNMAYKTTSRLDEQLIPIIKRIVQAIIITGALLQILQLMNVNITALIAGVSIGGLALALAAQDTVKNFLGSATIFIDKPFQIGDFIKGDGFSGTVVEVGFRTTRIQPEDTSITSIPNGQLMNMNVTNLGMRKYRLFSTTLSVEYNTPATQLQEFIEQLKKIILNHPHTRKDAYHVRLVGLGESAFNILYQLWIDVPSYSEELKVREEVLFDVIQLANRMGVSFAYPTSSIFIETQQQGEKDLPLSANEDEPAV